VCLLFDLLDFVGHCWALCGNRIGERTEFLLGGSVGWLVGLPTIGEDSLQGSTGYHHCSAAACVLGRFLLAKLYINIYPVSILFLFLVFPFLDRVSLTGTGWKDLQNWKELSVMFLNI
jgi:hypothetical protein